MRKKYVVIAEWHVLADHSSRQRPYCVESTGSHLNSEVKRRKARIVLGWVTAREVLWVLLAFFHREKFTHEIT